MQKDFIQTLDSMRQKKMTLTLNADKKVEKVALALNAKTRREILSLLQKNSYTIWEIANTLNLSVSTISFHIKLLKEAGLVNVTHNQSKRGNEKIVALEKHCLEIYLIREELSVNWALQSFYTELPIGSFSLSDISAPCGIADADGNLLGSESFPDAFYSFSHHRGEIIWFSHGYLEYHFPNSVKNKILMRIQFSLEICSECANYNNSFNSNITFWLNDKEVCTYTSPGDFGGRRGTYTPPSWSLTSTQFGMLVQVRIDESGIWLNDRKVDDSTIDDFAFLTREKFLRFRLGVKEDAKYVGGLNLFGKKFGDFPQGIRFSLDYKNP